MDVTHMRSNNEQQRNLDHIVTLVNNTEVLRNVSSLTETTESEKVSTSENHGPKQRSSDNEIELENTPINDFVITNEQKHFLSNPTLWKTNGCVDKIFCEVMIAQPQEADLVLESKMVKYIES